MPPKLDFTPGVATAIIEIHSRAFGVAPTIAQEQMYVDLISHSLVDFESRYKVIPFFLAGAIHSFEAFNISTPGERYPKHVLRLVFVRRGLDDYLVGTREELSLGRSYSDVRLMEEVRHIYGQLPDIPATPPETE